MNILEKTLQVYIDVVKKYSDNEQITSDIINETTAILEHQGLCDHLHSMKNTWDYTREAIINYLLAFPMPLQNSKFLGYNSIDWIKNEIEGYERQRQIVLMNLIRTLEPDAEVIEFTEEQQQLFFKHTAIKGFGIEKSFGDILNKWRVEASRNIAWMQENLFFKIIIQNQKKNDQLKAVEGTASFKIYLFNETVTILCHHPKSLLPQSDFFKKELLK